MLPKLMVRAVIAALFAGAALFAAAFSIHSHERLPGIALGQPFVCRVEVYLAIVYGGLLLLTPLFYGLLQGRLPIEISHRGARWQEAANETIDGLSASVRTLQQDSTDLRVRLVQQQLEIQRLAGPPGGG
jgi:hypothetical protein